jgi:hypothetical protein
MTMNAQVNFETLPSSIRRDGGKIVAHVKPPPPTFGRVKRRNLDSKRLMAVLKGMESAGHFDANETGMFLRALLYVMPQPYEYKYPAIRYADLFPINYSVPTGAQSHAFHQFDEFGNAQLVDNYADNSPNVERMGIEVIGNIYGIRSEYSYSIQDLRAMAFSGIPLDAMKAVTARRVIERKCDALAAVGDSARGFTGLVNNAGSAAVTASTKAATGTKWGTLTGSTIAMNATPDEIVKDCTALLNGILIPTKGTHTPDTLIFGTQNWAIINTLRLDTFNMVTVATYLMQALPWVKSLEYWPQLDTAGASSKERVVATERNRENYEIIIPQEFEQFPPQMQNLAFKVPCHKRFGGIQYRQPAATSYMDATVP